MSRKYEGLIVLNIKGIETSVNDLVATVSKELESEGAKVSEVKELGRREFAYPSRHLESGHYVSYQFKAEPSSIEKIQNRLRLNEQVHVQYFQRA